MKAVYEFKWYVGGLPVDDVEFYSSVESAHKRIMRHTFIKEELKPFHAALKKAIKDNGTFKNSAFELTKHIVR